MARLTMFASREPFPVPARRRKAKPALFGGYWQSLDGKRLERATRAELREAARIYWQHKDVRVARRRAA